jgi:mRNA interferase MazF
MYEKNFEGWSKFKQKLDAHETPRSLYFHEREIWWCSLGINVGSEFDGKNELFERPAVIVK